MAKVKGQGKKQIQMPCRITDGEREKLAVAANAKGVTLYALACDLLSEGIAALPNVVAEKATNNGS